MRRRRGDARGQSRHCGRRASDEPRYLADVRLPRSRGGRVTAGPDPRGHPGRHAVRPELRRLLGPRAAAPRRGDSAPCGSCRARAPRPSRRSSATSPARSRARRASRRTRRHAVPGARLAGAARHPSRPDAVVSGSRRLDRRADGGARGRRGQRAQSRSRSSSRATASSARTDGSSATAADSTARLAARHEGAVLRNADYSSRLLGIGTSALAGPSPAPVSGRTGAIQRTLPDPLSSRTTAYAGRHPPAMRSFTRSRSSSRSWRTCSSCRCGS